MTEGFKPRIVIDEGEVVDLGSGDAVVALASAATVLSAIDQAVSSVGGDLALGDDFHLGVRRARRHPSMPTLSIVRDEESDD